MCAEAVNRRARDQRNCIVGSPVFLDGKIKQGWVRAGSLKIMNICTNTNYMLCGGGSYAVCMLGDNCEAHPKVRTLDVARK